MQNINLAPEFALFPLHTSHLVCINLLTLQLFYHFFLLLRILHPSPNTALSFISFFHNWRLWLDTVATEIYLHFVEPNPLLFFPLPPSCLHQHRVIQSHPTQILLEWITPLLWAEWLRRVVCLFTENCGGTFAFNARLECCSSSPLSAFTSAWSHRAVNLLGAITHFLLGNQTQRKGKKHPKESGERDGPAELGRDNPHAV